MGNNSKARKSCNYGKRFPRNKFTGEQIPSGCVYTTSFLGCRDYNPKKWRMSFTPSTSTAGSPIICDRMLSGYILRFLIRSLSQNLRVLTPNHMVNYFQPVTAHMPQTYVALRSKRFWLLHVVQEHISWPTC